MKIYCQNCGYKVEFSANSKPKFCHNCATPLNLGSNVSNAIEEEVNEEEPDATSVPTISALEIEIHTDQIKGEKLGDLLGTSDGGKGLPPMNFTRPKRSKKEVLKDFSKEAGALRKKKPPKKT